jgi:heme-degrading monooxygenase HmoA
MSTSSLAPVPPDEAYCYLWSYRVRAAAIDAFVAHYRPGGEWAQLFARAPGYRRTDLWRDRDDPQRFITIDYWDSLAAHRAFLVKFSSEYTALDERCAGFTESEFAVGEFAPMPGSAAS